MSYDLRVLAANVTQQLCKQPLVLLSDLSRQLEVERHTLGRALRVHCGKSFRELQNETLIKLLDARIAQSPGKSLKEISLSIGYNQARSLARRFRRITGRSLTDYRTSKR
jgi:AraC-like DNA-binding protein